MSTSNPGLSIADTSSNRLSTTKMRALSDLTAKHLASSLDAFMPARPYSTQADIKNVAEVIICSSLDKVFRTLYKNTLSSLKRKATCRRHPNKKLTYSFDGDLTCS